MRPRLIEAQITGPPELLLQVQRLACLTAPLALLAPAPRTQAPVAGRFAKDLSAKWLGSMPQGDEHGDDGALWSGGCMRRLFDDVKFAATDSHRAMIRPDACHRPTA